MAQLRARASGAHPGSLTEWNLMDRITSDLVEAARSGEAAVLDLIDTIDPKYYKLALAFLALSLTEAFAEETLANVTPLR